MELSLRVDQEVIDVFIAENILPENIRVKRDLYRDSAEELHSLIEDEGWDDAEEALTDFLEMRIDEPYRNGPFMFSDSDDTRFIMERFEDYPYADSVLFTEYAFIEVETTVQAFINGQIDAVYSGIPAAPDLQGQMPDYYGICERIEETHGRLLETLEATGQLLDTVVVFVSDQGSRFRTRDDEYKRSCHKASVRVPLVVRGPGFEGRNRIDRPVSLVDLPATLLDAAGIEPPAPFEGDSAMPLVEAEQNGIDAEWIDDVFIQISEAEVGRAIRRDRWKYAVYALDADGYTDPTSDRYREQYLYDLAADPYEQVNSSADPNTGRSPTACAIDSPTGSPKSKTLLRPLRPLTTTTDGSRHVRPPRSAFG